MKVSPYTRYAKRIEKLARIVILFFVVFTMAILTWIILYVLVRGFYMQKKVTDEFAGITEEIIQQDNWPGAEFLFVINSGVRVKALSAAEIRLLYTKNRNYWGPYSGQNLKAVPFIYTADNSVCAAAGDFILGQEMQFSRHVQVLTSAEELVTRVESTPGGIGYIGAAHHSLLKNRRIKVLAVKRIVFPVNASVKKIVDNKQVGSLPPFSLEKIINGRITNWQDVGGIDLPVRLVLYRGENGACEKFLSASGKKEQPVPGNAEFVKDAGELCRRVAQEEGAVGVCFYNELADPEMPLLSLEHTVTGINLDIHYIIEAPAESGAWGGISTIILNTLFFIIFTLLFSTPVGIFAAIYLVEYSRQNRAVYFLRLGVETLAGIPSIIFGLFGFIFFVVMLKLGIGFISAVLTITMMILPTIIRTCEEALKAVPVSYREGSLALGATKLQTIFKVVLPAASPGILSGVILALGRTVGETAVLIYTMGSNYELVSGPSSSARVLSLHLYNMFSEAISFDRCFATAAVLIFVILFVNFLSRKLIGNLSRQSSGFLHHERKESDVFLLFRRKLAASHRLAARHATGNVENHFLFAINKRSGREV